MKACRQAFTLIEIMLVVVVIGVVATIAGPRIIRRPSSAKWENVLEEVNNLVFYARQEAIANHQTYRLHFKVSRENRSMIQVELEADDPEKANRKIYTTVKSYYFNPRYVFPEPIEIVGLYHTKENEFDENNQHAYCYVIPNGLVQATKMHLEKKDAKENAKATFEMLPFFGRFVLKEDHEK